MPTDSSNSPRSRGEKISCFTEVSDTEKWLWACIHSKGVLHNDVKNLYHKACCIYEKLFLNDSELHELQNIEYLLWRLHYKHIDEFRKRLSESSAKLVHMEGFRSFLSDATKFYQDLIRKIKRFYGLVDEPWFYKNDGVSGRIEWKELHKCQFVIHRLCICLGDLARYQEVYEKPNNQQRNWSVAASHYLEAAKIYPDGGNPQNQLAVLATYIGDEFLALYHCIRSLAVKEPFQDALQNLILLFERNTSINMVSQSNEVYDFCKPSDWISSHNKAASANGAHLNNTTSKDSERDQSMPTYLWTLIIRMTSFFFLDSSLESFPSTFSSTLRELEALLAVDVVKLSSTLESYQNMNLAKAGPYRSLHIISVLLFIIHNLNKNPELKILKPKNEMQQTMLVNFAWTVTFTFMGRFIDRCLKGSPVIYFPLLPALLVFVEWLVGVVDVADIDDEKCDSARRYFFGSFVNLLKILQENRAQITFPDHIALWEDYELRGFTPVSHTHDTLDFSSHWEEEINYKMKNEYRAHRIVQAAIKIAKRSDGRTRKWLFYDDVSHKFSTITMETKDGQKPAMVEEEEDIVFKPIIRHNSEPLKMKDQPKSEGASDACLRRASSLLVAQNEHCLKSSSAMTTLSEGPTTIAAGPPSLSSWVLDGERLSNERTKGKDAYRSVLKPIAEVVSDELGRGLSLSTNHSSGTTSLVASPSSYSAPSPSASLLPRNPVWFINAAAPPPSTFVGSSGVNYSSYHSNFHQASSSFPSLIDHSSPWSRPQSTNHAIHDHYAATMYVEGGPPLFLPSSSLLQGLQGHPQRVKPYAPPVMTETRLEPRPLLQYLKEREWQLQQQPPFTGFPYMQN